MIAIKDDIKLKKENDNIKKEEPENIKLEIQDKEKDNKIPVKETIIKGKELEKLKIIKETPETVNINESIEEKNEKKAVNEQIDNQP